jgi:Ca2+-binding EF-hand superfamily protein
MQVASTFNRPGNKDAKLRLAFKMQDFDGDDKIDAEDLRKYFDLVARNGSVNVKVGRKDVKDVIAKILAEASSDAKQKFLSFEDFQRVLATTDFDTNLKLNLY